MHSALNYGLLAVGTLAYAVKGETIKVDVGEGGLMFNPSSITAAKGDVVEFHFYPQKHSVVQGSFASPCAVGSLTGGFNSGFVPSTKGEAAQVFQVTISSTDPMYFYCSQVSHCQNGMVGVINGPSSGDTLDAYKTAAAQTSDSESPSSVTGGILAANGGSDDESSSSSAEASTSSAEASTSSAEASTSSAAGATTTAESTSKATTSAASSATSSAAATVTGNSGVKLGRVSYEMLGLVGVAGGVAVLM